MSNVFARKQQAALSLEELEREEGRLLEKQRHLNQLVTERSELEMRLRQIDNYAATLNSDLLIWKQRILDHLFDFGAHAVDRSSHATVQINLAKERLEVLPIATKEVKSRLAAVKAEITALEKAQ